jgi:hypothetical protein
VSCHVSTRLADRTHAAESPILENREVPEPNEPATPAIDRYWAGSPPLAGRAPRDNSDHRRARIDPLHSLTTVKYP